jgi:O-methyltransferase involved in polyketide biosynthesis
VSKTPRNESSRISFTAHYTGYVWKKHKLAEADISTSRGWWLYQFLRPLNFIATQVSSGGSLETFLLQRHQMIDEVLAKEIEAGRIGQIIELASGFSPRGEKFAKRYGQSHGLVYIESDLKEQILVKQNLLKKSSHILAPNHHFVAVDAFSDHSPESLEKATQRLIDPTRGCAILTEGLLSYFTTEKVLELWERIAIFLAKFPEGVYISDLHLTSEQPKTPIARIIRTGIEASVRGRLHLHFEHSANAKSALIRAGFSDVSLLKPRNSREDLLRIICARVQNT